MNYREVKPILYRSAYELYTASEEFLRLLKLEDRLDDGTVKQLVETIVRNAEILRKLVCEDQ